MVYNKMDRECKKGAVFAGLVGKTSSWTKEQRYRRRKGRRAAALPVARSELSPRACPVQLLM